jgi:hypothetical protein
LRVGQTPGSFLINHMRIGTPVEPGTARDNKKRPSEEDSRLDKIIIEFSLKAVEPADR